ncbi:MAG: DUF2927 domain-containing protein [Cyanobacteria bacterium J06638_20]
MMHSSRSQSLRSRASRQSDSRRRKTKPVPFILRLKGLFFASMVASAGLALLNPSASLGNPSPGSSITLQSAIELQPGPNQAANRRGEAGDRAVVFSEATVEGVPFSIIRIPERGLWGWVPSDRLTEHSVAVAPSGQLLEFETTSDDRISYNPDVTNPSTPSPAPLSVSSDAVDYFLQIAMGSEWGSSGGVVRKWTGPVRIGVQGNPTYEDEQTLNAVISELNRLIEDDRVTLTLDNRNPNVVIRFVPESQFRSIEPNYRPRNLGFFWLEWNSQSISNARILISTTGVTQQERSHLIREELTQVMGLMRDSYDYADSIFYQRWTDVTEYAAIDREVIQLLYQPTITFGMSPREVSAEIARLRNEAGATQASRSQRW